MLMFGVFPEKEYLVIKKIFAAVIALAVVVCLIPAPMARAAQVAYPVVGGNIYFDESTGTITACSDGVTEADIPAEINGVA